MREFTKAEKKLLSLFVDEQNKNKIENLQVAKILRENIPFFAISWETEPKGRITIHVRKTENPTDWSAVQKTFMSISDFMYFLKELESYQFIKFVTMSNLLEDNNDKMIYDRSKLGYDTELESFTTALPASVNGYQGKAFIQTNRSDYYLDAANELNELSNKIIYPLPVLREYVHNGYKTQEDIYQRRAMRVSICALIVAVISMIISIIK
ncbi:MAG: hypothetical protein MJY91_08145 [Bacteroidales bacterium]|nr:hypothetical protein [Bacteroidales bacterium]